MTKTEKDPAHGTCLLMGETNPQETNPFRWCLGMPEEREDSATSGADKEALSGLESGRQSELVIGKLRDELTLTFSGEGL